MVTHNRSALYQFSLKLNN